MTRNISVSIIICTCNRAGNLRQTLDALGAVRVPPGCVVELIVADNASTDGTADVVANTALGNMRVVHLFEPKKGKSNAFNSAMVLARGEIIVSTDDDVVPSEDWLEQILLCFDKTQCDVLVGKVILAPHLERPWMRSLERDFLAVTDFELGRPLHWVGANAAFRRGCLQRVRMFDPELGPGAIGNGEDTLFGWQLVKAGFKMEYAAGAMVVHHLDVSRLTRRAWLQAARDHARTKAYLLYHWEHSEIRKAALKCFWYLTKLRLRRMLQPIRSLDAEGCPRWERSYEYDRAFYGQYCIERRRPRNYAKHGLEKLDAVGFPAASALSQAAYTGPRQHSSV